MTLSASPALSVDLPAQALTLLQTATPLETPCGKGALVWHVWGRSGGRPDLAPLVLLHGGSGSWTHWLCNIACLVASGRQVLVPDLPGFGDSALPEQGTDADVLPEPIEQGLQGLLGQRACDMVGFSFGGLVGGLMAVRFPARVARLVLVGSPGLGLRLEKVIRLHAWRRLKTPALQDAAHRHNLAAMMLHRPESITELAVRLHAANVQRDRMKGRRLSGTDMLARSLAGLQCPVAAVYGREDALYRGNIELLAPVLRQAANFEGLALIDGAGHWVQFERPDKFNQSLLAALGQKA